MKYNIFKWLFSFFLLLHLNLAAGQAICFNLDSVVITYIPINISTTLSLSDFDVKSFTPEYRYQKVIRDSTSLQKFIEYKSAAREEIICKTLDARLVIEAYSGSFKIYKVIMDRKGDFCWDETICFKNDQLFDWLKQLQLKNFTIVPDRDFKNGSH